MYITKGDINMHVRKIKSRGYLFTQNLEGWDLNMYLIKGERCHYIIDTGLGASNAKEILSLLEGDSKEIIVVNTHYHWDHIWGNGLFKNHKIIAHSTCRDLISREWTEMLEKNRDYKMGDCELILPNIVFEKELYFPEEQIRLIYTPGHTIDSISILDEKDKVLVASDNIGDTIDEIIPNLYCDKSYYRETLNLYEKLDFDTCISGHNDILGKNVLSLIQSKLAND